MLVRILLLSLIYLQAFGCALCSLYSPTAHVNTAFEVKQDKISAIKFTWTFSENFSQLMQQNFDLNSDKKIDDNELRQIRLNLLDYLVPRHFLVDIEHFYKDENATELKLNLRDYKLYFDEGRLKFNLAFNTDLPIKNDYVISVEIFDKEGYFNFKFLDSDAFKISPKVWVIPNPNSNVIFYTLSTEQSAKEHNEKPSLSAVVKQQNEHADIDAIDEQKFDSVTKASLGFLDELKQLLRQNSETFKFVSFSFMLLCSFIYGFLHAAGAGHGKMLTGSYFAATGGSYVKAALFSLKIGFLHVIGAFLFVCLMFALLSGVSAGYTKDAGRITTVASAIVIIAISLYMFYKKLKFYTSKPTARRNSYIFDVSKNGAPDTTRAKMKFQPAAHAAQCGCNVCAQKKAGPKGYHEWLVAAAAALIPCPGTILVFVLAHELGSYFAGFMSGVFMALGMSVIIFIAAVFGAKLNQNAFSKLNHFKIYAEFLALAVMLGLGVFILFTTTTQVSVF
ncbi:nickel/cobalt transporter [Campylobacter curvus]|uniref:nickel/cobalt transporter n=1 Tax=Campylobacter curvus TaxID=200 RepID=UPI00036B6A05|nr:DUF1007 family protein [Campylobacter curvus]QKF60436.1 metal ion ABC transporter, permease protein [Campylobacter curvus]UEB50580.1 DUF1007 family protein [Campylobacter curvus]